MIKIITESKDQVSNEVIEYLLAAGVRFRRINSDIFSSFSETISNTKESECEVIWHRRAFKQLNPSEIQKYPFTYKILDEQDVVNKFIEKKNYFENNIYYGGYIEESQHNKLYDLYLAKKIGLIVPDTIITNKKSELKAFKKDYAKIITKPIKDLIRFRNKNYIYSSPGTFLIEQEHIDFLDENFAISIFQQYIEKEIEIRIFYFDGIFFSMAIFSQNDERTKIDFRNYNYAKQNRFIPFKLENTIQKKLKELLKHKKINTCSIDLILTPENEFVFLEINPQGQFGWVSKNCNYYIEKFIAEKLMINDEKIIKKRFK
ncbi:glutathione synthetase, ATP-grasp domain [Chryseobacterium taeanense]|uniref:Glutathione synthetase, ATP-grasp domain n=1 Tax=Chryseobacterium taeanense TaxID=311334 RepID=A0A1G8GKV0_9FLAO|nr:hypothetical protein [Chryseobacterium taeanense]SDH94993.1 glutathione synthetase, ATP-grasp domain [Chryseobacterium taeanense]